MTTSLRWGSLLFLVALVASLMFTAKRGVDQVQAARYRNALRDLRQSDRDVQSELLRTRAGASRHYDDLVRHSKTRKQLAAALEEVPDYLPESAQDEVERALLGEQGEDGSRVGGLADDLKRQSELIEAFKIHHAVLRHNVRYLPHAAKALVEDAQLDHHPRAGAFTAELNAFFTMVLLYHDFGEPRRRDEGSQEPLRGEAIKESINKLREWDASFLNAQQRTAFLLLLDYASMIVDKKVLVDEALDEIESVPVDRRIEQTRRVFERNHDQAAMFTIRLRYTSFMLAIGAILCGAAFIILRLKASSRALEAVQTDLLKTNEDLARERDKQTELAELKSAFVSMTSHEFRTPLSAILSSAELLESYGERWGEDKRRTHLHRIQGKAKQMKQMVEAVLLIGKSEAGMLKFEPRPIDVTAFIEKLVEEQHLNVDVSHQVDLRIDDDIPEGELDPGLLGHLLTNLISNAMKYSPDASEVGLDVALEDDELVIAVSDDGIGISEEDQEKLFETFHRGANVGNISGTGLGLSIVHKAVTMHGGRIEVESELGDGTTFVARLPLHAKAPSSSTAA